MLQHPRRAAVPLLTDWTPNKQSAAFAIAVIVATAVAYIPAIRGGFVWDDDFYVSNNKTLSEPGGLRKIWTDYRAIQAQFYPLVYSSYWIEYRIWGLNPVGYHLSNILLHACSAVLIGRLLHRLAIPGAWLAATIFALHPVHVESVAWITERKNVLSGLFYLLALGAYIRFAGLECDEPPPRRPVAFYALCLLCFIGALLAKTVTASLPAVIALLIWWRRGRWSRTDVATLIPMFVIGAAFGLMTIWIEKHHVGASGEEWNLSTAQRFILAGRAVWFYAGKLIWPVGLTFIYPRWQIDMASLGQYVPLATLLISFAVLWFLRNRVSRGPLVAALCFVGTLFPALGFINVFPFRYSFVADHFQYLASIFVIVPAVAWLAIQAATIGAIARKAAATALVIVLSALTFNQARAYYDMESLWRDTIARNPTAWMAYGNLGDYLAGQERYEEAITVYQSSLKLKPDAEQIQYNLGLAFEKTGKWTDALDAYERALRLKPTYAEAQVNLGAVLSRLGRNEEALKYLHEAVRLEPNMAVAHYNLGNVLGSIGRLDEASGRFHEAIRIQPDYWEAWINDAAMLWQKGRIDAAIDEYREVLRRNPYLYPALLNLGSALMQQGRTADAVDCLERAVQINGNDPDAHFRLALGLISLGRRVDARRQLEEVVRLKPNYPGIQGGWDLLEKPGT